MRTILASRLLIALLTGATLLAAPLAQADRGGYRPGPGPGGGWHYRHHDGRLGWWWVPAAIGATWLYMDSRPVYPAYPATVVVQPQPEPIVVQPAPQPQAQSWYYCDSARAYYPYVESCPEGWRAVPAVPPAPAARTTP